MKKGIGFLFLIISIGIFLYNFEFNLTGNNIKEYFNADFTLIHILGLVFLVGSFILFISRESLDAIIIPTGPDNKTGIDRAERAAKEKTNYYVISGYIDKTKPAKESQTADIYKELKKYRIKPSEMKIESESKDSLDNVIYSLSKLKGMKKIGIVSYPEHLKRFDYIIKKAKNEGLIDKNIEIVKIPTNENTKEKIYGILANIKEKYRLRKGINKAKKNKTGFIGNILKKIVG